MKKTLSLILALLMSVSCASFAFADDEAAIAEEAVVEEATPYDEAIIFLQDNKIMQGMEDGLIHAEKDVKRYEMAILAGRVSTGWVDNDQWMDDTANDSEFSDLEGTAAEDFYGVISYAAQKGIVEGYTDGTFKPEQQVTYREALTMAVRTLGYTGLEWPWGYIEKAVALGITDGIEDIAYTTPLNRGVVAQIVYNTLFAKVNGSTLAMNIFGIDRAWENILVTADNRCYFAEDGAVTAKDGQVAFQIINENGTLDDEVYYVYADLEVGHPYRALFNVDEDTELVELVKAIECESVVTVNAGITDNEGNAIDNPYQVEEVIGKYDGLNNKWDLDNVLSNSSYDNDLILVNAINMGEYVEVTDNEKYAYEIATGNILNLEWKDGKSYTNGVKWYYSEKLDCYFEEIVVEETGVKLYNIVDEDDVEDLLGDRYWTKTTKVGSVFTFMTEEPDDSAYAQVEIWDVDGKSYGWYESYKLGEISYDTDDCLCDEEVEGTWVELAPVNSFAGNFGKSYFLEGQCEDCDDDKVTYRWVEGYEPSEDAKYVIYGVNEATRELKIVKEVEKLTGDVEDLTDVDTYYANGIVRGYRMSKGTITIGDVNYAYDYDTLLGNAINVNMKDNADGLASRAAYSEWFGDLLNQYVEYVVVDGKIVYLEVVGASSTNLIVVEKYVGVSSDGYIVVGGYSLENLSYELFRIASYDGWKTGDKFWYGNTFDVDFVKGAVYEITSYDASTDTYNVKNIVDRNGMINASDVKAENVTIAVSDGVYRTYTGGDPYKMKDTDKYIIVPEIAGEYIQIMPIFVYEGKLPESWHVTGDVIVGADDDSTIVMVNADFVGNMFGFNKNVYKYSMVVALDAVKTSSVYDGYGEDSWYIQGATSYEVEAWDIYAGGFVTVTATNIDVEEGKIYAAIDGEIVQDVAIDWAEIDNLYTDSNANSATIIVSNMELGADLDRWASDMYRYTNKYDLVDDVDYFYVTFDGSYVVDIEEVDLDDMSGYKFVWTTVVYDPATEDAIVYIYADTAVKKDYAANGSDSDLIEAITMYPDNSDESKKVNLNASIEWTGTKDGDTDKLLNATVTGVTIGFEDTAWTHAQLLENGCVLGLNAHDYADYIVTVDDALVSGVSVAEYTNCYDCVYVQSISIVFDDAIVLDTENDTEYDVDVKIVYQLTINDELITAILLDSCTLTFTMTDSGVDIDAEDGCYNIFGIDAALLSALDGLVH